MQTCDEPIQSEQTDARKDPLRVLQGENMNLCKDNERLNEFINDHKLLLDNAVVELKQVKQEPFTLRQEHQKLNKQHKQFHKQMLENKSNSENVEKLQHVVHHALDCVHEDTLPSNVYHEFIRSDI